MDNQDKDYYIFNNNVIFYADKFDINKHVKFIFDKNEFINNRYVIKSETLYKPIIQNTIWNEQNHLNPNVYIYFNPVKLSNNPIFSFNEKFHKSKDDFSSRYLLAFNKSSDNYNQYKKVFKNIDSYMINQKQKIYNSYYYKDKYLTFIHRYHKKPKLFYNCLAKDKLYYDTRLRKVYYYSKSKNVYYKIHLDPILKSFENKRRLPFSYQKVFKIDKNNNINQIKYNDIDMLSKDLHKGVYISTIIKLNKLYFTPPEQRINDIKPEVNYGVYPICEQIIIHENIKEKQNENVKKNETNETIKTEQNIFSLINIVFLIFLFFIGIETFYMTDLLT